MEVILLDKVQNLGDLGSKVTVKPGYGRNYLIPKGKAVPATKENVASFEARRSELEKASADALIVAKARAKTLNAQKITIARKAGEEGKLFGSVGTSDIAQALKESGIDVKKQEVRLPHGALRQVGEYEVSIHLHSDVDAIANINIVAD